MKRISRSYLLWAAALLAAVHACHAAVSTGLRARDGDKHDITFQSSSKKVIVELFVMSRCPDAKRAETRFDEVFGATHAIATPRLVHIASINGSSVTCMHGEAECHGNVQQLCAQQHRPFAAEPFHSSWAFVMCQDASFQDVGSEDLATTCLKASGYTGEAAARTQACWSGREGPELLRRSAREARDRKAARSATIFINHKYRCTHDGGKWYDCHGGSEVQDFVASICQAYRELNGVWQEDVCGEELSGQ